jgi:hypothetical protein
MLATVEYQVRVATEGGQLTCDQLRRAVSIGLLAMHRSGRLDGAVPAGPIEAELASAVWTDGC